jgi:hypothetical protein
MRKIYIAVLAVLLLSCIGKPPAREVTEVERRYYLNQNKEYMAIYHTWLSIGVANNLSDCHYAITSLLRLWLTPDEATRVQQCFKTLEIVQSLFSSLRDDIGSFNENTIFISLDADGKATAKAWNITRIEELAGRIDASVFWYTNFIRVFNEEAAGWNSLDKGDNDLISRTIPYISIPSL